MNPVKDMKLMILGYARHGKDTVAQMLKDHLGINFCSSSLFCAEKVLMPAFGTVCSRHNAGERCSHNCAGRRPKYATVQECFEDRVNHRTFWHLKIAEYAKGDLSRLTKEIFKENQLYVGCRNRRELHAAKAEGLFDFSIWVDRSKHLPPEASSSMDIEPWMADFVLDNNGDLCETEMYLKRLVHTMVHRPYTGRTI